MPELSVIVPTYNERDNVAEMVSRLEVVLADLDWEVVFVDDNSADGTAQVAREIAQDKGRVRCLERVGRRGLSSAVVEGALSTSSPYIAVMDGDLQHDEKLLPRMLGKLRDEPYDIVVGSRFVEGGGLGEWSEDRVKMSQFATKLSRLIVSNDISDPMSGFFMIRREAFEPTVDRLSSVGFKILLDIFASSPKPLRLAELPFQFGLRQHGESKVDTMVLWEYLMLILDKMIGRFVPVRFILFALVGGAGVVVHFLVLSLLMIPQYAEFATAQLAATFIAMTSNFYLNNLFTYRDKRLRGSRFIRGLLTFYAVCSIGVVANVGVANFVFEREYTWWIAGFAGILVGTVWNYAASSIFTWKTR